MKVAIREAFEKWKKGRENITYADFLRELGMSRQTAHNLEEGKGKHDTLKKIVKMSEMTGIPIKKLIIE